MRYALILWISLGSLVFIKLSDIIVFQASLIEYKLPMPTTVHGQTISYSDHEAVNTRLLIKTQTKSFETQDTCSKNSAANGPCYGDTLGEGIEVLDQILKRLRSDKNVYFVRALETNLNIHIWYFISFTSFQVMAFLLIIPLFFLIDVYPPFGMGMLFLVMKMIFSGIVIFFIFMATMWNSIERNGILSTKLSMEMARIAIAHYDNGPFHKDPTNSKQ